MADSSQTSSGGDGGEIELSVVIPCLDEADTLAICIEKAQRAIARLELNGEVVVADNGSEDGSQEIAREKGARLISVVERGYGNALIGGIGAARGRWIVMGDADDSYDFEEIPKLVEKLRAGFELVQGCRLPAGGGHILPGAMPPSHRWIGNPLFSFLSRWWFRSPFTDIYCGLRGFTRDLFDRLDQRCAGMEFATEMIIKASLRGARTAEVPITFHPDGRTSHRPHLKTLRDGWRTLRFFLLFSPRWLFLVPGLALIVLGVLGYALALPRVAILGATLDAHTMLFASLSILLGYQTILFAIFAKTFGIIRGLLPRDSRMDQFFEIVNLERGLVVSFVAVGAGTLLIAAAVHRWWLADFGPLVYSRTMRLVIQGATLTALGFQPMFSSFFVSILGLDSR